MSLPETNKSPWKIHHFDGDFHGRAVSFREGTCLFLLVAWNLQLGTGIVVGVSPFIVCLQFGDAPKMTPTIYIYRAL